MRKILFGIKFWFKIFILVSVITAVIAGIVAFVFKPIYSVTLNGELIGYCSNKRERREYAVPKKRKWK